MNKLKLSIAKQTPLQRWQSLQVEVLTWLIGDGEIDDGETVLLRALCELYRIEVSVVGGGIRSTEWNNMHNHACSVATIHEAHERLLTNIVQRLTEDEHCRCSGEAFQTIVDWITNSHYGDTQRRLQIKVRACGSSQGVFFSQQTVRAAKTILESFRAWTIRCESTVDNLAFSSTLSTKEPTNLRPFNKDGAERSPIYASRQDSGDVAMKPGGEAITLTQKEGIPLPAATVPSEHAPEVPDPLVAHVEVEAIRERLQTLGALNHNCSVLEEVVADPEAFFRDNAAFAKSQTSRIWFLEADEIPGDVWFAGDVHGDLLAFEAVCRVFDQLSGQKDRLIFLGDLVDRGFDDRAVIISLWSRMKAAPGRFGWVVGNHDIGIAYDSVSERFTASVAPAEFVEWLNDQRNEPSVMSLGQAFVCMAASAPCAIFLPGLLAAHGGFPHSDRWEAIQNRDDLAIEANLSDFVWNRIAGQRTRIPNRSSRSSSFGSDDFDGFRTMMKTSLGWDVQGMVRGHDHVHESQERWSRPTQVRRGSFNGRILTINTLSHNQPGEINPYTPPNPRKPTLARWKLGGMPTPIVVDIPAVLVSEYAHPCPTCLRPRVGGTCSCVVAE